MRAEGAGGRDERRRRQAEVADCPPTPRIEPGIYLTEFSVRSEIDCYVTEIGARATGRVPTEPQPSGCDHDCCELETSVVAD